MITEKTPQEDSLCHRLKTMTGIEVPDSSPHQKGVILNLDGSIALEFDVNSGSKGQQTFITFRAPKRKHINNAALIVTVVSDGHIYMIDGFVGRHRIND